MNSMEHGYAWEQKIYLGKKSVRLAKKVIRGSTSYNSRYSVGQSSSSQ